MTSLDIHVDDNPAVADTGCLRSFDGFIHLICKKPGSSYYCFDICKTPLK